MLDALDAKRVGWTTFTSSSTARNFASLLGSDYRKKLAGILIETKISGQALVYAIVGIGLNVNLTAEQLPTGATSIFLVKKKRFSLEKTLSSILPVLERHYETFRDESAVVGECEVGMA